GTTYLYSSVTADVTILNPSTVAVIFNETAALSLPPPGTVMNCPADLGIFYHLEFSGTSGTVTFDVNPTGCWHVLIGGAPRALASDQFWPDLAAALGISESTIYPYKPLSGTR